MSWQQLDDTLKEQAAYEEYYAAQPPAACPRCGEPLRPGPPSQPGVLYCPFDSFRYPEDFDPLVHSGM